MLASLAPWLLAGALVAGILHVLLPAGFLHRHLGRRGLGSVLKATLLGVPMPLCSCSVIPTAIGIKKDGASDGAAVAFLISTPQTGVDSIFVSASFLGLPFAIFKVFSAFVTGMLGGVLVNAAETNDAAPPPAPATNPAGAAPTPGQRAIEIFRFAYGELLRMIWVWVVVGVLVSAAISSFVPADKLGDTVLASGIVAMLLMLVISLPLYVCATSSVPIAAALVQAGLPTGAALVFLMAGPASNVATVGAVYRAFGKRVTAIYLAVIMGGSVLFGYLFDSVLGGGSGPAAMHHHAQSGPLTVAAVVILLLLLVYYAGTDLWRAATRRAQTKAAANAPSIALQVSGMTCSGCVGKLRGELSKEDGVASVEIDLETGRVEVFGQDLDEAALRVGVKRAGLKVVEPGQG